MRDPGSLWSPLKESGTQGSYAKDKFIVHSTGNRASAMNQYKYFNGPDENESTFVIGLSSDDPTRQLLDSSERADANLAANMSAISVEVVGTGDDAYTDWQVRELIRLGRWAHDAHKIPLQQVQTPTGAGFGWHIMFGSPGPWTGVVKVCPGAKRVVTLKQTIFPAIFAEPKTAVVAAEEDDSMVRIVKLNGADAWYVVDYGQHTMWLIPDITQYRHLTDPVAKGGCAIPIQPQPLAPELYGSYRRI